MTPNELLSFIAGQAAAIQWLPTGQRMGGPALNSICCFAWSMPTEGLPFQARSRGDRAALDELRRSGLVEVLGATSGTFVKLTIQGMSTAGWSMRAAHDDLKALSMMPTIKTPSGQDVVMGFDLVDAAGQWWTCRNSATQWELYLDGLAERMSTLTPLLIAGWARQLVSLDQQLWAVTITAAGRQALAGPPPAPMEGDHDADAFARGRTEGKRTFSTNPPDAGSSVASFLPCSKWFH